MERVYVSREIEGPENQPELSPLVFFQPRSVKRNPHSNKLRIYYLRFRRFSIYEVFREYIKIRYKTE